MPHLYKIETGSPFDDTDIIYVASDRKLNSQEILAESREHSVYSDLLRDRVFEVTEEENGRCKNRRIYDLSKEDYLGVLEGKEKEIIDILYSDGSFPLLSLGEIAEKMDMKPMETWRTILRAGRKIEEHGKPFERHLSLQTIKKEGVLPSFNLCLNIGLLIGYEYMGSFGWGYLEKLGEMTGQKVVFLVNRPGAGKVYET